MQFTRLRLSGFKSFVDAADLPIYPGLTGVIGPNGCGKSNLLEALRWVMGENSAKRMRGSEMEDVIFNGTSARPKRNIAEVTLEMKNSRRTAPAAFNDFEELELSRRIERGKGSDYRLNGKSLRMRDVQILFADHASGANSPAMVSQGKVAMVINAKPLHRRMLLEEAAGIAGLRQRRHEAELKLRAAEENLTRLDDVLGALETQMGGLKRQARQAMRYRRISEELRQSEAMLWLSQYHKAEQDLRTAHSAYNAVEGDLREAMVQGNHATTLQAEAAAALPQWREAEARAAAALQRLIIQRETLDQEARRISRAIEAAEARLQQTTRDRAREVALEADAQKALAALKQEGEALAGHAGMDQAPLEELDQKILLRAEQITRLEEQITRLSQEQARSLARREALEEEIAEISRRIDQMDKREEGLQLRAQEIAAGLSGQDSPEEAAEDEKQAEHHFATCQQAVAMTEEQFEAAQENLRSTQQAEQKQAQQLAGLETEIKGIERLLSSGSSGDFPPLIDALTAPPGMEVALAALLGDDSRASLDPQAPIHWRDYGAAAIQPDLPEGCQPLAAQIQAPPALTRLLAGVGLIADEAMPDLVQLASLKPGQILLRRDGGMWRWDGRVTLPGTPSATALRLEQRNKMNALRSEAEALAGQLAEAVQATSAAEDRRDEAQERLADARKAVTQAFEALGSARARHAELLRAQADLRSQKSAVQEALAHLQQERAEQKKRGQDVQQRLAALPQDTGAAEELTQWRQQIENERTQYNDLRQKQADIKAQMAARQARQTAIAREEAQWQSRITEARARIEDYDKRIADTKADLRNLTSRPDDIEASRARLAEQIEQAEIQRREKADQLAEAENQLREIEQQLKAANARLSDIRESRAKSEAQVEIAQNERQRIEERLREALDCTPQEAPARLGLEDAADWPASEALTQKIEKLKAEREAMGPVNLCAEQEISELETELTRLTQERSDLMAAIAKLRQAIGKLNHQARGRLVEAFENVNTHFRDLFTRLFGGGDAHLELTDAEDPLEAGLEIFASPPGKKLQHLSLLSGGEQALTALSLIFAVFMTVPAPICVLDEVDAPLDEANVDRFCTLLEELAQSHQTRFLLITHHRMTMARMDRLFGVTMGEQGVSQLVSVDLAQAEALNAA